MKLYAVPELQINIIDNNDISINATIQTKCMRKTKDNLNNKNER